MKILFILTCLFQMGFQKPQIPKHIAVHDYASELNENIQGRIAAKAILEGIAANAGTRALNKAQGKDYFIGGILKALLEGIAANAGTRALNKAQGKDYFIG